MRRLLPVLAFLLAALLAPPVSIRADQTDPRLPELFDRLLTAESALEGRALEGLIWRIWMTSEDAEVSQLMKNGVEAMAVQDHRTALATFDQMVEIAPDFAEGWNKRATVHYLRGDYAASLQDINRTLALEPRHFGALSGLGLVHSALDEEEAALEAFERALAINPHMTSVRRNIEELKRRIGGRDI
jgi:tetratricopeptide (TPR) repeat protein